MSLLNCLPLFPKSGITPNTNLNCYKIGNFRCPNFPSKAQKLVAFSYFFFIHEFSKYSLNNNYVPGTVPYIGENSGGKGKQGPSSGSLILAGEKQTAYKNIYVNFSQEEGGGEIKTSSEIEHNQECWNVALLYKIVRKRL